MREVRILKDDDGHTYFVQVGKEQEFQAWLDAVYSDVADPTTPDGVTRLNSHLSCYVFRDPELRQR
jgi:hypothetical protein